MPDPTPVCLPARMMALRWSILAFLLTGLALVGCQSNNPPVPTVIPTITRTATPTPSPSGPVASAAPSPTLRPIIEATAPAVTAAPVGDAPTASPTAGPKCFQAKAGDTILSLLYNGGYGVLAPGLLEEFRRMNNMPAGSNVITAGETYCVPRPTPTPSPPGLEATQTKQCLELGCGNTTIATTTYTVVEGDTIISVQLKTGATLRQLCDLNSPSPLNCAGCNIDKPIGEQGCRPLLRVGDALKVPGPTPTPTITPTLTGSETATPTPPYGPPTLVAPINGSTQAGLIQLVWLPVGILQPDEQYLVVLTDITSGKSWEFETQATSYRLPIEMKPTDGQPHTINWRVGVARKSPEGAYVVTAPMSLIYTFIWQ